MYTHFFSIAGRSVNHLHIWGPRKKKLPKQKRGPKQKKHGQHLKKKLKHETSTTTEFLADTIDSVVMHILLSTRNAVRR